MAAFWITIPLMVVGVAIAVLPLLITIRKTRPVDVAEQIGAAAPSQRPVADPERTTRREASRRVA